MRLAPSPVQTAGRLRVGSVSDPDFIRIVEVLVLAVERYPLLELEVRHEMSTAALAAVEAGDLDASFYFGNLHLPSVAGIRLSETVYRVAAPLHGRQGSSGAWRGASLPRCRGC